MDALNTVSRTPLQVELFEPAVTRSKHSPFGYRATLPCCAVRYNIAAIPPGGLDTVTTGS